MERTLRARRKATHRFTVTCFTTTHHGLLDAGWRRIRRPSKPPLLLSSTGNSDLYSDDVTKGVEFSVTMAT
jgi:hypothetical protein